MISIDIAEWLRGLSLEQYAPAFAENAIEWEILPKLTSDDLKEIGVAPVGHRRKLLEAIAVLRVDALPPARRQDRLNAHASAATEPDQAVQFFVAGRNAAGITGAVSFPACSPPPNVLWL